MLNTILTKPTSPFSVYSPKTASIHNTFTKRSFLSLTRRRRVRTFRALKVSSSISSSQEELDTQEEEADARETELFEELNNSEIERIKKKEEFERKANVQLDRQLILASQWSRYLLRLQGKLKDSEWDPQRSHDIHYSDFKKLIDTKNVQFMEYADFGQSVTVILPYRKDGKPGSKSDNYDDMIFRSHAVDKMPIDGWNGVWNKLHEQLVNVDVINVNVVHSEIYSTMTTFMIWSMRLALSIAIFVSIDNMARPIYDRVIPYDLGFPEKEIPKVTKKSETLLGSLGKSRATFISAEETTGTTFDDFAGQEYIKKELQEIVRILKDDEEYQDKGIYCPRGVLLHGPPGTGKTLLARAIAGEAGLPFFASNGTDFVEMFVGVAASRVKDLFAKARSFSPCIIFIDEIDAIGSKRGGPDQGGGGAEREQGLLQILTEMDGFKEATSQILIIGATNRLDILDPALLRKGRFDKIIRVGLPSKDGRLAILKVHAKNKYFTSEKEKETLLDEIAEQTVDFTGAELQNILNEAAILTSRQDLDFIGQDELAEALKRQKGTFETGLEDVTEVSEDIKLRLAYREAAIAVLACYYPNPHRPFKETDIHSVNSKPNMQYIEPLGKSFLKKSDYVNRIIRACAPRIIEEEMFGIDNMCWMSARATSQASSDIEYLILQTGWTAFGKAFYKTKTDLVPNLAMKLECLKDEYLRFATAKCRSIIKENYESIETITDVLLKKGEIKADEIWEIFEKSTKISQPPIPDIDEDGALIYSGRWGIYGLTLPGRVTFVPGNIGFSTFGAPRPMETQIITDDTLGLVSTIWNTRLDEIKDEINIKIDEEKDQPILLMPNFFL